LRDDAFAENSVPVIAGAAGAKGMAAMWRMSDFEAVLFVTVVALLVVALAMMMAGPFPAALTASPA
jgi:hypothetical protein